MSSRKIAWKRTISHLRDLFHLAQIIAIAFAQTQAGPAGSEHMLPEMREGMSRRERVNDENFGRLRRTFVLPPPAVNTSDCQTEPGTSTLLLRLNILLITVISP